MRTRTCEREHEIAAAARGGAPAEAIREHVRACSICAETLAVTNALRELSHADVVVRPLADARVLWLKAQLAPRLPSPLAPEGGAGGSAVIWVAVAACWAVLISWRWSELHGLLERLSPGKLMVSGGDLGAVPVVSLVVVAVMTAVTLAITLHQVFIEEL